MLMDFNKNYYEILGVNKNATLLEITKAKDNLKWGPKDLRAPISKWNDIDEAYYVLSNEEKRLEYDKHLNSKEEIKETPNTEIPSIKIESNKEYDYELNSVIEYSNNLMNQIDSLLLKQHELNKLKTCQRKYQIQIELFKRILDIKYNSVSRPDFLEYSKQFDIMLNNLKNISKKIENYNNN